MNALDEIMLLPPKARIAATMLKMTYLDFMEIADEFSSLTYDDATQKEQIDRHDMAELLHCWAHDILKELDEANKRPKGDQP